MSEFDAAFDRLIDREGGYSNDPADAGGETKFGISQRAYPDLNIRDLTLGQAKAIYRRDYWDRHRMDELPARLSVELFDAVVNHGAKLPVRWLQIAIGAKPDGVVGPQTIAAARQAQDVSRVLMRFHAERLIFYTSISGWSDFGRGWVRRVAHNMREG